MHVDMDAFFAAVEIHDNPQLETKPVVVGGLKRGVVAAASYEARKYGIRSAMPMFEAQKKCKDLVIVFPRIARYQEVSQQVMAVFLEYSPLVEALSLDEAFIDVTASLSLFGSPLEIGHSIKRNVQTQTGLTCSVGISNCKFLAKIASDMNKPDGMTLLEHQKDFASLMALPIERMWGLGERSIPKAKSYGFHTWKDLVSAEDTLLVQIFGTWGPQMKQFALGNDPRDVVPHREAKSIGSESTLEKSITQKQDIERELLAHASRIAERMLTVSKGARTLTLKFTTDDFEGITRSITTPDLFYDSQSIFKLAKKLLEPVLQHKRSYRLVGLSASQLQEQHAQMGLFEDPKSNKKRKVDELRRKLKIEKGVLVEFASLKSKTKTS